MPIRVVIDDDSIDKVVVAALKRDRKNAKLFRGPQADDGKYYRELSAAITVVLKHYTGWH